MIYLFMILIMYKNINIFYILLLMLKIFDFLRTEIDIFYGTKGYIWQGEYNIVLHCFPLFSSQKEQR